MSLLKFRPTRTQARPTDVVADLDALIASDVAFTFQGRTHRIRPITTETFFKVTNAIAKLDTFKSGKFTQTELLSTYADIFESVCDTITKEQIKEMTQAQVGALFALILDCITGRAQSDEKKKNIANQNHSAS